MSAMKQLRRARHAMAMAAVMALSACGGGGGGGDTSSGNSNVSMSGYAAKGLLANAKVEAWSVTSAGLPGSVLQTTYTDANGHYQLDGLTPGQLVIIKVSSVAASGDRPATTMKDEASQKTITLTDGQLALTAVTTLGSSTTSAQVTPFSEMAYQAFKTQAASVSSDKLAVLAQTANSQMATALGVSSIIDDAPTFTGGVTPTNALAVKLAAVSQMAKAGAIGGCTGNSGSSATPTDVLNSVQCVVNALKATSAGEGSASSKDTVAAALNTAQSQVDTSSVTDPIEKAKAEATVAPQPATLPTNVSADTLNLVSQAKALIRSLRNTAAGLNDTSSSGALRQRVKAVADEVSAGVGAVDPSTVRAFSAIANAMAVMDGTSDVTLNNGSFEITDDGVLNSYTSVGKCQFYTGSDFATQSATATSFLGCRVTHGVVRTGETTAYAVQTRVRLTQNSKSTATPGSTDNYTLVSALIKQSGSYDPNTFAFTSDGATPTSIDGSAVVNHTATASRVSNGQAPGWGANDIAYNNFSLVGDIAPGVDKSLSRQLGYNQYANTVWSSAAQNVAGANTRMTVTGEFTVYGAANHATLQSSVKFKTGTYFESDTQHAGVISSGIVGAGSKANVVFEATAASGATTYGTLQSGSFVERGHLATPTTGTFVGTVKDSVGTTLFSGQVDYTLRVNSSTHDLELASGRLQGNLLIVTGSTLSIDLSDTSNASTGVSSFTGTYTQTDGASFSVAGTWHESDTAQQALQLTSAASGLTITFHQTDASHVLDIKKGTQVAGQLDVDAGRINYADGSYEMY